MPTLHMMIGVPCSGKSTLVKKIRSPYTVVLSTDDVIEWTADYVGTTYTEQFQFSIDYATKLMNLRLRNALDKNKDIIWDQTNLTAKSRRKKLESIPPHYTVIAHYIFPPPIDVLLKRNALREGKFLSPKLIQSMYDQIEMPTLDEGFDLINTYDQDGPFTSTMLHEYKPA